MDIETIFSWLQAAAVGGLDTLSAISEGATGLFINTTAVDGEVRLTLLGALAIAGVGAPLAWKFIKYIISLFKKVQPN